MSPRDRPLGVPDRLEIAGDALQADISIICHELDPHFYLFFEFEFESTIMIAGFLCRSLFYCKHTWDGTQQ
jgi:hypothetical protein